MTEEMPEPRFTDKRRLDPETGKLREGAAEADSSGAPGEGAADFDGAAPAGSDAPSGEGQVGLAELKAENAKLADDLARANAAHYNVSQEYAKYVRRSKEDNAAARREGAERVAQVFLSVLDDIELARQHGDLQGPLGSIAENVEATFATNFKLERFGAEGDEFDPRIHEAMMVTPSKDVTVQTVDKVIQPGYRMGEKILRPARVAVADPE